MKVMLPMQKASFLGKSKSQWSVLKTLCLEVKTTPLPPQKKAPKKTSQKKKSPLGYLALGLLGRGYLLIYSFDISPSIFRAAFPEAHT